MNDLRVILSQQCSTFSTHEPSHPAVIPLLAACNIVDPCQNACFFEQPLQFVPDLVSSMTYLNYTVLAHPLKSLDQQTPLTSPNCQ